MRRKITIKIIYDLWRSFRDTKRTQKLKGGEQATSELPLSNIPAAPFSFLTQHTSDEGKKPKNFLRGIKELSADGFRT